jgi:hypothetical protein
MLWRSLWDRWVEACFLKVLGLGQKTPNRRVFEKNALEQSLREQFVTIGVIKKQC